MKVLQQVLLILPGMCILACNPVGDRLVKSDGELSEQNLREVSSGSVQMAKSGLVDRSTESIIRTYGPTVKRYASQYGFDWRLILAVMKCESSFVPNARSHRGAFGFMQLMPQTGNEIDRTLSIDVTAHPSDNIHGGIYYLSWLYKMFRGAEPEDRLRLTLAAYNAGIGRITDAQDVAAYLDEDPNRWESVNDALPLLSKRYYTLHSNVWESERPGSGWFGSSDETVTYVRRIMEYYGEYSLVLN